MVPACLIAIGLFGFSLMLDYHNRQTRDRQRRLEQWKYRITVEDDGDDDENA